VTRPEVFGRNGDHVRGALTDHGGGLQPLYAWRAREHLSAFSNPGRRFDLLVRPHLDHWRGGAQARLVFVDGCNCEVQGAASAGGTS